MGWTKRDIVIEAYKRSGLSPNGRNLTAQELQDAMYILDSMMSGWTEDGIVFTPVYPQPTTKTGGDLDDATNGQNADNKPMYENLAVNMAEDFGKSLSPRLVGRANVLYNKILARYNAIPQISLQGMARGAGAKRPLDPFFGDTTTTT